MRRPVSSGEPYWSRISRKPRAAARRIDVSLAAATQKGGCGLLPWRGLHHDVVERPEFALVREPLARRPCAGNDLDRLLVARVGLLPRNIEAHELVVAVALADAKIEPAARHHVDRRRLLGEQHRVVPRQHHHRAADAQRGRSHGKAGQQRQRGRNLVPAGEMMLDQKRRAIAQRLGLDVQLQVVMEALPALGRMFVGAGLRGAEQSELHFRPSPSFRGTRKAREP